MLFQPAILRVSELKKEDVACKLFGVRDRRWDKAAASALRIGPESGGDPSRRHGEGLGEKSEFKHRTRGPDFCSSLPPRCPYGCF